MLKKAVFLLLLFCAQAHAALKIQAWTLPNGAQVLFVESHSIPILDVSVEFDAGARRDPPGKSGTAALTNGQLARGVREAALPAGPTALAEPPLTEAQISDAFADLGAQMSAQAGTDRAGMRLRTLSSPAEREHAVQLLARILAQPAFPADLLERDRARTIAAIKEELTQPEALADRAFSRLAYRDHPYAFDPTVESVTVITRDDLLSFYHTHYVANRAVVALIGDISRTDANALAQELTRRLPEGAPLPAMPPVPEPHPGEQRIPHPASQSHILLGSPALARGDADYFPLIVGNYVLGGGGFVSRLMQQVREQRGLAYGVDSAFEPLAQPGPFEISLQTKKAQTDQALQVVRDTLAAFLREGPSAQELQAAKDNLINGFPLRIDNNRKILENIAMIGFYHLPLDYLDTWTAQVSRVTAAQVKAAFNRKIAADRLATVIVGGANP